MSDKWNDKLRRQMAEYTETPPEGLWEGIEEGLQKRRAAAFPWWWALAGAAAAVLAVLLLWRPGAVEPQLATDAVAEAVPDSREDAVVPTVSATPQTVNNINVLHSSLPSELPELAEPAPAEPEHAERYLQNLYLPNRTTWNPSLSRRKLSGRLLTKNGKPMFKNLCGKCSILRSGTTLLRGSLLFR